MNTLPPLSQDERGRLRASVMQDGIIVPVLHDARGNVIDGHHRQELAAELGIVCPTQVLDVDDETADRLRLALNWARRQLDTLSAYELIAELAERHEARAKAEALVRKAEGGAIGGRGGKHVEPSSTSFAGKSREAIADMINDDLKAAGEGRRVTGRIVEYARNAAALPQDTKEAVRKGELSVTSAIRPPKGRPSAPARKPAAVPAKPVPEHVVAQARIRAIDAERKYASMLAAPAGKLNLPLIERASKVQQLLLEVTGLTPEKAVSGLPAMRCREFSVEMAEWWLEFARLCEKRRQEETPDLPSLYTRPRLASFNPVVSGNNIAPVVMSPTMRAVYDWLKKQTEPITVVEAAVATKINRSSVGDVLRKLVQSGRVEVVGTTDDSKTAFNLYQVKAADGAVNGRAV